jgi:hypothetical protein
MMTGTRYEIQQMCKCEFKTEVFTEARDVHKFNKLQPTLSI